MSACIVCTTSTQKYKCNKCAVPYCSLKCYKEHQNSADCKAQEAINADAASSKPHLNVDDEPTEYEPFSTDDTLTRAQLEALRQHEPLKALLYNPHLRNLLHDIDVAPNACRAMNAAMQEPLFTEFANECLKIVEPISEDQQAELMLASNLI